ncbi:Polycystin-2 (Curly up) (Cup) (Polycystic kidney disease 2 protein homolog) (Transient receptor potential cation channel subfamily P member 2) [Durusdinium trenchii]|uniref:Polycystin-2 (Curly up) (Cup) (Polycystic kidney disease 2 protein homolog) (Transient receptor potential cation channel subfamily P member 2) n=1 Tax=Durusdinium trenchii TaxID=1381693 RepID=A0ABP0L2Z2_9DINO
MDRECFGPPNEEGVPSYDFSRELSTERYEGYLATYPFRGYMEMFTPDYPTTHNKFLQMQNDGFISEKTRAIFLEFTIYNFNLGLYGVNRIVFEVAAAGDWTQSYEIDVPLQRHLQPLGTGTAEDWLILIFEAGLVLFVLRYVLEEASEFVGVESKNNWISVSIKWDYFLDAWNVLD